MSDVQGFSPLKTVADRFRPEDYIIVFIFSIILCIAGIDA
jgi:hypothetical protein